MKAKPIDQALVRELFRYNPKNGELRWRVNRSNVKSGDIAGCLNNKGYLRVRINGVGYLVHRVIWVYTHGDIPDDVEIDHRNGIRHDNRIANLRLADHTGNRENLQRAHSNNKTCSLGVSYNSKTGKYRARIGTGGESHHLGHFKTEAEADAIYKKAKREHHKFCTI